MGKVTAYHPVSLHVLRGAVEYCGFKFGTLRQTKSDVTGMTATYNASIEKMPKRCEGKSLEYIRFSLQQCFNVEVVVLTVRGNSAGKFTASIRASIPRDPETLSLPEPEPEIAPIQT